MSMMTVRNQSRKKPAKAPRQSLVALREGERSRNNTGLNAVRRLEARRKLLEALEMRYKGKSWSFIADQLGYADPSAVRRLVYRQLAKEEEPAIKMLRKIQRERTEQIYAGLVANGALEGKPRQAEVAVKVLERAAKLDGLDVLEDRGTGGNVTINLTYEPHWKEKDALPEPVKNVHPIIEGDVVGTEAHRALEAPEGSV